MNLKEVFLTWLDLIAICLLVIVISPIFLFMFVVDKIDSTLCKESYDYD